ncbi:hypothetical protein D3OALGA1CA_5020 [Olavius algarvensis associated proteobacterium Delta 3]|nr:hypothetical protein D3OALGA1CA_5020 [Olavius algarvensis associated proteobacterium Delta 3]
MSTTSDTFRDSAAEFGCRWDPEDPGLCFEADACGCFLDPCTFLGNEPKDCVQDPCEECCAIFEHC